jgi:uncharacterized protein YjbJ (UPF0337 family)
VGATGDRRFQNERETVPHNKPGVTTRTVAPANERNMTMGGKMDQIKGRIKEATGVITDDDRLKREGKLDQVVGKIKEKSAKATEKIRTALTGKPSSHRTK